MPQTVHYDDVNYRLPEIARLSHTLAAVPRATHGYPFPATNGCVRDDNNQNSGSGFV